ncbi:UDP-N-acetylglucosamine 4,6-dehydratase [hydrothermal vent metagenome]|uniref:UDP-N-acetylglucosamine 4,6-dehydratase n=1 Tax=hydrothermal vent metagenome TaxID=652676 RepID=A0A3B0SEL9_9ZZZZ
MDNTEPTYSSSEMAQILGREEHEIDLFKSGANLTGKKILITGAAGSIGNTLSRAVAAVSPAKITLFDHDEYGLYRIRNTLEELQPKLACRVVLGDVRDRARLARVFSAEQPDVVFHVAALKHVGMVEDNPAEGAATNVLGTRNVADATLAINADAMVLISTDKAVCPRNIMGATKKLAEMVCRHRDISSQGATRFLVVRFGNVFGSSGSVVPLFQRQIATQRAVTITDSKAERFFMTEREAVALLLDALQLGMSDFNTLGGVFIQDMGQRVLISDLAKRMIRAKGLTPDVDVPIVITGLRAGEKVLENLHEPGETVSDTPDAKISLASSKFDHLVLQNAIIGLEAACRMADEEAALRILGDWLEPMTSTKADHAENILHMDSSLLR